jgi:NAD(P)-dependent dehydrogenase (short-subunit alcohol dehydrogenase family)
VGRRHPGPPQGDVRHVSARVGILARPDEELEKDARLINTTSVAAIYVNLGQTNNGAAKAGIAAFTQIAALELGRYGVTANAVAPGALTRLSEDLTLPDEMLDRFQSRWVAPLVVWLASPGSRDVTGQVFESSGVVFGVAEGRRRGPSTTDVPGTPEVAEALARKFLADAAPRTTMAGVV